MNTLTVKVNKPYDILIKSGVLKECGKHISAVTKAKKVAIITDSNVGKIYLKTVETSLQDSGFETYSFTFPAGEEQKTLATVEDMLAFLSDSGLTRKDIVVALGGGVCGDMAGFASAIYLRGIDFVQIPTSLLAQIDSSVGGKTGADLPQGKNLVGAFHQPNLVLIDPEVLNTLPEEFFTDGMGEAIKYGCIRSKDLFDRLAKEDAHGYLEELIYQCVDIKRDIVERDEKESGERMLLNFGHTLGHSLEKYHNFTGISHGMAVGIGMLYITRYCERLGLSEKGSSEKLEAVLKKYNMPTKLDAPVEEIINGIFYDKKRASKGTNFVIVPKIGESKVHFVSDDKVKEFFSV